MDFQAVMWAAYFDELQKLAFPVVLRQHPAHFRRNRRTGEAALVGGHFQRHQVNPFKEYRRVLRVKRILDSLPSPNSR